MFLAIAKIVLMGIGCGIALSFLIEFISGQYFGTSKYSNIYPYVHSRSSRAELLEWSAKYL